MRGKGSLKKRLFLLLAAAPFVLRRWSIQKKLYVSLLTLIIILGFNAILTSYEVYRLKEQSPSLSYLVYLDVLGIVSGTVFIWILLKSVIRPMKNMVREIETKTFVDPAKAYGLDEIGDLARAVSSMKRTHSLTGEVLEEKTQLIEAILDHAVDSIFIFNANGEIISSSRSFKETFGYADDHVESIDLNEIIPSEQLKEVIEVFSGESPRRHFYVKELEGKKSNQRIFHVECSICPVRGSKEQIFVAIVRNLHKKNRIREIFRKMGE